MVQAAADDLGMDQAEFRRRQPGPGRRLPAPHAVRLPHRLRAVRQVPRRRPAGHRLRRLPKRQQEEAKAARPAARHRHLDDDRAARGRQQPRVRHPRHQDVRLRRAAGAHDRQGDPAHRREVAGPGPRDDVGPDRRPRARHPGRGHRGRGGRHRHRAVRDGHLRLAQHAGRRCCRRDGLPQDPGQGAQARRPPARGVRGGRRLGARPLLRPQLARPGRQHPGVRDGGVLQHARRPGARPGGQRLLRPAQPHLAVRLLHLHRRGRPASPACGTCSTSSRSTTAGSGSTR